VPQVSGSPATGLGRWGEDSILRPGIPQTSTRLYPYSTDAPCPILAGAPMDRSSSMGWFLPRLCSCGKGGKLRTLKCEIMRSETWSSADKDRFQNRLVILSDRSEAKGVEEPAAVSNSPNRTCGCCQLSHQSWVPQVSILRPGIPQTSRFGYPAITGDY
jgi:hypothetical protein